MGAVFRLVVTQFPSDSVPELCLFFCESEHVLSVPLSMVDIVFVCSWVAVLV